MTDPSAAPPPPPGGGFPPPPPAGGGFAPPPPTGGVAPAGAGPVRLGLDAPLEIARWRPFVQGILIFPYAIVVGVIGIGLYFVSFIAFFTVLFTKRIPEGMFRFMAMALRVSWRSTSYQLFLR